MQAHQGNPQERLRRVNQVDAKSESGKDAACEDEGAYFWVSDRYPNQARTPPDEALQHPLRQVLSGAAGRAEE
jgi:hypothetical protein